MDHYITSNLPYLVVPPNYTADLGTDEKSAVFIRYYTKTGGERGARAE